jgi:curved DNA-binding protein CbpA
VTAAYRCLAQRYHPDRGGDDEAMVRLNSAVACIRAHQANARPRA